LKAIEKEGLQGGKGDSNWVVRHVQIHDPGIQQEPTGQVFDKIINHHTKGKALFPSGTL
jgi:hypothetical protein